MKQECVRFILKTGAFINSAPMPEANARELVRMWAAGDWKLKGMLRTGQHQTPGHGWAVSFDDISAMHTFDPAEIQPPVQLQQPAAFPGQTFYLSGA